ncbi:hypothetical protein Salat_1789200 [Sesamum alatum]|uniref:Uncharacterized protein n=1 Tax=Sesamum alatum TaxID=300844 RepID=A0AAE1Y9Q5_9LAMI|nr:hypothetical protein Salat_1789200 [Sesamum alatum]
MEFGSRSLEKHSRETDHVSIEIMTEDNLASSIKEKMELISLSHSVCRVPEELLKGNEAKYFPSSVSIGPFHRGTAVLQVMEDQKWRYLNALISRNANSDATLESCIRALRQTEHKARNFYTEKINMGNDQFVEMMLLDGCFIIELFLAYAIKTLRRRDDPCFSTNDMLFRLKCDLILLENQVPFFILEQLFHLVPIPKHCHMSLIDLALCFFKKLIDHSQSPPEIFRPETHHFLDLIRQHYLPTDPHVPSSVRYTHIDQATHLESVGIRVEKTISEIPSNINFFHGKLKIPSLEIHGYTEILFRNLIAMELSIPKCSKHVTSYVILMERLMRSTEDVRLLRNRDILIDGHERREEEIVLLFKSLHVDINVKEFYYGGVCEQIEVYQTRKRHIYDRNDHVGIAGFCLATLFLVFLFTAALILACSLLLHRFQ